MNTHAVAIAQTPPIVSRTIRSIFAIGVPFSICDELILIRGLPGSGKTTRARSLAILGFEHFEDAMHFERNHTHRTDSPSTRDAAAWCQKMTRDALADGKRVVVRNTFTRLQEMEPYRAMFKHVRVVEAKGNWGNLHGVPAAMVQRMAERWDALPTSGGD